MSDTKKYLLDLVLQYRELLSVTGPIKFGIDQNEAKKVSAEYIWSLVDYDDGNFGKTLLVNSFEDDAENFTQIFDYGIAQNPYPQGDDIKTVVEVVWINCDVCDAGAVSDPDDCERCEQNGTLFLDIESVAKEGPFDLSAEYVWAQLESS